MAATEQIAGLAVLHSGCSASYMPLAGASECTPAILVSMSLYIWHSMAAQRTVPCKFCMLLAE